MIKKRSTEKRRPHMRAIAVCILASTAGISLSTEAADALDTVELTALLRQLDMADRIAQSAEAHSPNSLSRYHFDYARLHADIARIRTGIEDHLSPRRAQPRDLNELSGDYRHESPTP